MVRPALAIVEPISNAWAGHQHLSFVPATRKIRLGKSHFPEHCDNVNDPGAYVLRETTGTTGLEQTARSAVAALAHFDIPHLLVGGLAVQEHGYHRVTLDVDLVVPDILEAVEFLTADLSGPFARVAGCEDRVQDRRNGVFVDLLPAGKVLRRGCGVPFPEPTMVSERPCFVSLEQLISLKLDSWAGSPTRRHKDKTDVIELIQARRLPRDLNVADPVRQHYLETWDALQAER
jgi:hypothetical protein